MFKKYGLVFYLSQNFCSEAVCYSEMITRKIERNQLGQDYKSFTVQVMPLARQNSGRPHNDVGSKCHQVFSLATQRAQQESRYVYTQKKKNSCLLLSVIYTCTPSLHFSVALLLFLLCFSTSTLCFSSSAPPCFVLALHRPEQHRACARFPESPAP